MEIEGSSYQQRVLDQLAKWEAGNSVHNQIDDECCPDFSCCHPKLQADKEQRQLYASSWRANRRDITRCICKFFI